MSDSVYFPTYTLRSDMSEDTAQWLRLQQGDGPLALEDVTDVCATFRVSAVLRDEDGWLRGRIDERGDYTIILDTIGTMDDPQEILARAEAARVKASRDRPNGDRS